MRVVWRATMQDPYKFSHLPESALVLRINHEFRVELLIHRSHNVLVLLYYIVCPAKYRRVVFSSEVDQKLKEVCLWISKRYEITFLEIGTDKDHVHFLVQSVPMYNPTSQNTYQKITCKSLHSRVPNHRVHRIALISWLMCSARPQSGGWWILRISGCWGDDSAHEYE